MPWKWIALKPQTYTTPFGASCMPERVERRVDFAEGRVWTRLEESIVQILVVVVIRQMRTLSTDVTKVISKRAIRWEWADPKRGVKYFKKERDWAAAMWLVRCLVIAKGKLVKIPVLDSACGATRASFGICLRQRKRTSSQEKEAAAEMSFLFKKVKREVWARQQWCALVPLERVVN